MKQAIEQLGIEQNIDVAEALEDNNAATFEEDDAVNEETAESSQPPAKPKNSIKRSKETQDYIDLVESTFEKFIRLAQEGFGKLWNYFSGLIDKFSKF